jgi:hypothetical protein
MKKQLVIATLAGALAFDLTAAVNPAGPAQASVRPAQVGKVGKVGQAIVTYPGDPPIIRR